MKKIEVMLRLDKLSVRYQWSAIFDANDISIPKIKDSNRQFTPSKTKENRIFEKSKRQYAIEYFCYYNSLIFDGALPADLEITWNTRLTSTAGMTRLKKTNTERSASIELSDKVLLFIIYITQ